MATQAIRSGPDSAVRLMKATQRAVNANGEITRAAAKVLAAEIRREMTGLEFPGTAANSGLRDGLFNAVRGGHAITMRTVARDIILTAVSSKDPEAAAEVRQTLRQFSRITDFKL